MLITIEGFGTVWSKRTRPDPKNPGREHTAYYNTTGIYVNGKVHHRSRIFGQLRFNRLGGFIAKGIERNVGRVFHCSAELAGAFAKLVFRRLADKPERPDFFLFAVQSNCTGLLQIESEHWKASGVLLFSLSQCRESQEAILLMPIHSWIRGEMGTFIVEPDSSRPWRATLRLLG
jgi:hypothetical protein